MKSLFAKFCSFFIFSRRARHLFYFLHSGEYVSPKERAKFLPEKISETSFISYFFTIYSNKIANLGDNLQVLATKHAIKHVFGEKTKFVPVARDRLSTNKIRSICVMQGWFETRGFLSFLPSKNTLPVWIGTHICESTQQQLLKLLNIHPDAFAGWEFGCRDFMTLDFFQSLGFPAYLSRCLTLTFPLRKTVPAKPKIFIVNCDDEIVKNLPEKIRGNAEFINQRSVCLDGIGTNWQKHEEIALKIFKRYENEATLVITQAIHCAQPCIAAGIPVVFFVPNKDVAERAGTLTNILPFWSIDDLKNGRVDFDCAAPNIEDLKLDLLENLRLSTLKACGEKVDETALKTLRERIANFKAF